MLLEAERSAEGRVVALREMARMLAAGPLEESQFCLGGQMDEEAPSPLMLSVNGTVSRQENTGAMFFHVYSLLFPLPRGLVGPCRAVLGSLR